MKVLLFLLAIPLAYLILGAFYAVPRDAGILALVFLNSVVWILHYQLKGEIKREEARVRVQGRARLPEAPRLRPVPRSQR